MGLVRLGLITVVNNRTLFVWIICGVCKPNDVVKRVTFMPCHFDYQCQQLQDVKPHALLSDQRAHYH